MEPIYKSLGDNFTYNAYANDIAWNLALAYVKDDQIGSIGSSTTRQNYGGGTTTTYYDQYGNSLGSSSSR